MKNYELSVLIHPDLEASLDTALEKVRGIITEAGGKIVSEDVQGKKKTAYRIKGQDFAIYVYMDVSLPADAPLRISSTFNITDEVLRYLLVITDEKGRQALAEAKESGRSENVQEEE
jgi:small subunit ribosomal protein S6